MRAWITRYALTRGVFVVEGSEVDGAGTLEVGGANAVTGGSPVPCYYHYDEWHKDERSARAKFEIMRSAAVKSALRRVENLANLEFSPRPMTAADVVVARRRR